MGAITIYVLSEDLSVAPNRRLPLGSSSLNEPSIIGRPLRSHKVGNKVTRDLASLRRSKIALIADSGCNPTSALTLSLTAHAIVFGYGGGMPQSGPVDDPEKCL
jgi:hypothetical protein